MAVEGLYVSDVKFEGKTHLSPGRDITVETARLQRDSRSLSTLILRTPRLLHLHKPHAHGPAYVLSALSLL